MTETLLATVAELAAYRGTTIADDDPAALFALAGASAAIRSYTGQDFDKVSSEEIHLSGSGAGGLLLPQLPVTDVDYVAVLAADETETEVTDYRLDPETGILWRPAFVIWPLGQQNILVSYSHGYASVPGDIAAVCVALASRGLGLQDAQTVTQEQIGTYQVTYSGGATGQFLGSELMTLGRYRYPRVA